MTSQALAAIIGAPFKFFLGGSRRMYMLYTSGKSKPLKNYPADLPLFKLENLTDWDFYITYSNDVVEYLKKQGFEYDETCQNYGDTEALAIMKMDDVQVVLRKDANFYRMVFDNIPVPFYYYYLWKSSPELRTTDYFITDWFNATFAFARQLYDESDIEPKFA